MYNISDLSKDFEILFKSNEDISLDTISTPSVPIENSIIFIKNNKYLNEFENYCKNNKKINNLCIVIDKLFFETINDDCLLKTPGKYCDILALTENIEISTSKLSKEVSSLVDNKLNDVVDGRQMGTCNIDPTAVIAQNVFIGEGVTIEADVQIFSGVVIMSNSTIGKETILFPNVTVYRNTQIGENVRIHSGSTIGSDGFGYNFDGKEHLKVWHLGNVKIENNVEIGSNTCIDRGAFGTTKIGEGTKIDNIVQVGHNCNIGKYVILCGQVGIGGSVTIGDYTVLGGAAKIVPGVVIGKKCQLAGGCVVTNSLEDDSKVGGHPARPIKDWMRSIATLRKLSSRK
ncbi:MAG: UDP-3-O-(3-hydroxymyristoyl)glucosamine N-acyltransferase [Bdellovibrionales bacterium]|jgi:UDP-3-O-[3-hydroxymyristoyl] glucosamine N-acyltransferase|nr:UDP-3-O-(3-hydroxymyristoyl)glucosamine N-acyltransferase [Bdellovibrionales bacterium]